LIYLCICSGVQQSIGVPVVRSSSLLIVVSAVPETPSTVQVSLPLTHTLMYQTSFCVGASTSLLKHFCNSHT